MTPWITVREALERLNWCVGKDAVYRLAHSGKVRTNRLGRILIHGEDFDRYVSEQGWAMITPSSKSKRPSAA